MKPGSIGKFWQQQGWAAHSSFADGGRHPPRTREARLKTMHWKPCFMHCLCHLDKEGWPKDDLPKCTWGLGSSEQVIPKPEATYTSVYELPIWEVVCRIAEQPIRMKKSFVCIHFFPPLKDQTRASIDTNLTQLFSINMVQQIRCLKDWNNLRRHLQIQSLSQHPWKPV